MHSSTITPLISTEELQSITKRLGTEISKDYDGKPLLIIGILEGSRYFLNNLIHHLTIPHNVQYMKAKSYQGDHSTGKIAIELDTNTLLTDYDVLIVEDIIDTGITITSLTKILKQRNPKSLEVASLLDKPSKRTHPFKAKYIGKEIADLFVVGYGMDYNGAYRNLPYVGVLTL